MKVTFTWVLEYLLNSFLKMQGAKPETIFEGFTFN